MSTTHTHTHCNRIFTSLTRLIRRKLENFDKEFRCRMAHKISCEPTKWNFMKKISFSSLLFRSVELHIFLLKRIVGSNSCGNQYVSVQGFYKFTTSSAVFSEIIWVCSLNLIPTTLYAAYVLLKLLES